MADVNVELGHAGRKDNWICIDKFGYPDYKLDLEKGILPFADNSVDCVYACHVLEHIVNLIPLTNEVWRILKPTGTFKIQVPMYPSTDCFIDPTHVRVFTEHTFNYWLPEIGFNKMYGIEPWEQLSKDTSNHLTVELRPIKEYMSPF